MELDDLQNSGGEGLEVECSLVSRGPDPDEFFLEYPAHCVIVPLPILS